MELTQIPSFGVQPYVHIVIGIYSGFVFASPRSGKATCHVIDHYLAIFAVMGKLLHIQTEYSQGYISTAFKAFVPPTKFFIPHAYPTTHKVKLEWNELTKL
jgi:hypothetical protein